MARNAPYLARPALFRQVYSARGDSVRQPERGIAIGLRTGTASVRWGFGLSLGLHAAALLSLCLVQPSLTPAESSGSVELVIVPVAAAPLPDSQPAAAPPSAATPEQMAEHDQPPAPVADKMADADPPPPPIPPAPAPEAVPAEPPPPIPSPEPRMPAQPAFPRPAPVRQHPPVSVAQAHPPRARSAAAPVANDQLPASATESGAAPSLSAQPRQAAATGPDPAWLAGVSAWLLAHRSYPEMARSLGRQGTVLMQITVDSEGHVVGLALLQGSGSDSLDHAAETLVRNAHLPPFPSDMRVATQSLTIPIHYRLE